VDGRSLLLAVALVALTLFSFDSLLMARRNEADRASRTV
jgi:hypothetical protein